MEIARKRASDLKKVPSLFPWPLHYVFDGVKRSNNAGNLLIEWMMIMGCVLALVSSPACVIEQMLGHSNGTCGNGIMDPGEACDDGNTQDDDGCSADCQYKEECGNDIKDPTEECDDGNTQGGDGCSPECFLEVCGDGIVNTGEECDGEDFLGNTCVDFGYDRGNLSCSSSCAIDTSGCIHGVCGDGVVDPNQNETCDDGVNDGTYGHCLSDCSAMGPHCGDGSIDAPYEQCDDGNASNDDSCPSDVSDGGSCQDAVCGDGFIWSGHEDCDDGNSTNGDGCDSRCMLE